MNVINHQHLADQVLENLNHQQLWTDLKIVNVFLSDLGDFPVISGIPFEKLHPDDPEKIREWVFPVPTEGKISIRRINDIFNALKSHTGDVVSRILMAMVTNDSTVVYYLIHEGLKKPRKN